MQAPVLVSGGWSHSVWRVQTVEGDYVIKEIVDRPDAWWIEQMQTALAFELAAWRSRTIPMAEPIATVGTGLLLGGLRVGQRQRSYRCHRWVEGHPCLELPPDDERSQRVGEIVAGLARLGFHHGTTADQLPWNALDAYDDTVDEAASEGMDWAQALAALRPHVAELRDDFVDLAHRATPTMLMHRDLDPKNASLRPDGQVALFDWDYAGPRLLASELLGAALSFAGGPLAAEEGCVRACVEAYRKSSALPVDFSDAAAPLIEERFRWTMLNTWICLGHRGASPEQQAFAGSLVRSLAPGWPESAFATRTWARWLAERSS